MVRHAAALRILNEPWLLTRRDAGSLRSIPAGVEWLATWAGLSTAELSDEITSRSQRLAALDPPLPDFDPR